MAKGVVIDELHVTIRVANDLPADRTEAVRQALNGEEFMRRLRRSVRSVVRAFPELAFVRVSLTR